MIWLQSYPGVRYIRELSCVLSVARPMVGVLPTQTPVSAAASPSSLPPFTPLQLSSSASQATYYQSDQARLTCGELSDQSNKF